MAPIPIEDLIRLLSSNELVVRTGLWLIPASLRVNEAGLAARFNMDAIDMRKIWLDRLPDGARLSGLRQDRLLEEISAISNQQNQGDCALLFNLDLLVSGLSPDDRNIFWDFSFNGMRHRARGLVYLFPYEAYDQLIDLENRKKWEHSNRTTIS